MTKNFKSLEKTIKKIVGDFNQDEQQKLYQRYHQLLRRCLPQTWQYDILLLDIEAGVWFLGVKSQQDAYVLRFLLPEIEQRLSKKLKNKPKLKIKVDPEFWFINQRKQISSVKIQPRQAYSEEEANAILENFIRQLEYNEQNQTN
ncbi:hypothetical protein [Rappaport israeli]|uniref:hypothetical protein n=1 Tax=Rappaport israeli TaxID=1839807 RepID=UPI0009307AB9|nr:hypothetical protein [Rappaport israeli]